MTEPTEVPTLLPGFDKAIVDAIVQRFFEPVTNFVPMTYIDGTGTQRTQWDAHQSKAPLQQIAEQMFTANKKEIMDAILARISIEDIVEAVAPKITDEFIAKFTEQKRSGYYTNPTESDRKILLERVWNVIAMDFGQKAVAYLQQTGGLNPVLGSVVTDD